MRFEWDKTKDIANQNKHRVSFAEAQTAFFDDDAIVFHDPDHSLDEEHFILLGLAVSLRVLVVVHCFQHDDMTIRIISARKATKKERAAYPGGDR